MKVLIVDDSLIVRSELKNVMESLGHTVVMAIGGKDAIKLYKPTKPDFVTIDMIMPDMNGVDTLRHIKQIDPQAKVIMATSSGSENLVIESIRMGALGYVLKPLTKAKMRDAIKHLFDGDSSANNSNSKSESGSSNDDFTKHLFDDVGDNTSKDDKQTT